MIVKNDRFDSCRNDNREKFTKFEDVKRVVSSK